MAETPLLKAMHLHTHNGVDDSFIRDWQEEGSWNLLLLRETLPYPLGSHIFLERKVISGKLDTLLWKPTTDGRFSTKTARVLVKCENPKNDWFERFWCIYVSPTISIFWWKSVQGWLPV